MNQADFDAQIKEALQKSIGQPEELITTQAKGAGWLVRVVSRDGKPIAGIQNFDVGRLNLTVVDGIVTGISRG